MTGKRWEPDDLVTLAEFVESLYPFELDQAHAPDEDERERFLDGRLSALRLLRRSHPAGFPAPEGASGRAATYRMGALVDWWRDQPHRSAPARPEPGARWALRRAVDAHVRVLTTRAAEGRPDAPLREALGRTRAVAAVELARLAAGEVPDPVLGAAIGRRSPDFFDLDPALREALEELRALARPSKAMGPGAVASRRLVARLDEAAAGGIAHADLLEEVLARTAPPSASGEGTSTSDSLAQAIVAAGDVAGHRPDSVLDLAAGEGALLLAIGRATPGARELRGIELDSCGAALATIRLRLHGVPATVTPGDSLRGPVRGQANLVVLDPPLKGTRDLTRWLERALVHLAPGGSAVVVVPDRLAAGEAEWLGYGRPHARTVVLLPSRLRADVGEPLSLWVLSAEECAGEVAVVNSTALGRLRGSLRVLSDTDLAALATACNPSRGTRTSLGAVRIARARRDERPRHRPEDGAIFPPGSEESSHRSQALQLARRLLVVLEGPLAHLVTTEQRRALERLIKNLDQRAGRPRD